MSLIEMNQMINQDLSNLKGFKSLKENPTWNFTIYLKNKKNANQGIF